MEIKIDKAFNLLKSFEFIVSDANDFIKILDSNTDVVSMLHSHENLLKNEAEENDRKKIRNDYHDTIEKLKRKFDDSDSYQGSLISTKLYGEVLEPFVEELTSNLSLDKTYGDIYDTYTTLIENFPDSYGIYWSGKIELEKLTKFKQWFNYLSEKEKIEFPMAVINGITTFRNILNRYDKVIKACVWEIKEKHELSLKSKTKRTELIEQISSKLNQSHFIRCLNQIIEQHYSNYDKTDVARLAHFMLFNEKIEDKSSIQGMYNAITTKIDSQKNSKPRETAITDYLTRLNK